MEDAFIDTLELFPRGLVYVGMSLALLVMAKLVQDLLTPYKIGQQLTTKDNVALALSISGYYLGVIIVFLGAVFQPDAGPVGDNLGFTSDYWQEVLNVLIYSAVGIVILNVARIVVDRVVLYQFSTEKEIIEDRNAGTGAVEFGVYVAVSLVIAGSISGEGGGPEHSLVFLALGLATLVLYTLFYELTTPYKIHDEIERNNASVGVALGGNLIAIGIISLKAIAGDFVGWSEALAGFITFALLGFILLLVVRRLTDFVLFPRVKISNELAVDQNLGVGLIMAAVVISVSAILFFAV
jgi:uncharacterized membrane protein YjfL (UPF0719 family)